MVAAELFEFARGQIEHPVVAAGVGAPDALAVGVDQQPGAVVGEFVAFDGERLVLAGGDEPVIGNQYFGLAGGRVVGRELLSGLGLLQGHITGTLLARRRAGVLSELKSPDPRIRSSVKRDGSPFAGPAGAFLVCARLTAPGPGKLSGPQNEVEKSTFPCEVHPIFRMETNVTARFTCLLCMLAQKGALPCGR